MDDNEQQYNNFYVESSLQTPNQESNYRGDRRGERRDGGDRRRHQGRRNQNNRQNNLKKEFIKDQGFNGKRQNRQDKQMRQLYKKQREQRSNMQKRQNCIEDAKNKVNQQRNYGQNRRRRQNRQDKQVNNFDNEAKRPRQRQHRQRRQQKKQQFRVENYQNQNETRFRKQQKEQYYKQRRERFQQKQRKKIEMLQKKQKMSNRQPNFNKVQLNQFPYEIQQTSFHNVPAENRGYQKQDHRDREHREHRRGRGRGDNRDRGGYIGHDNREDRRNDKGFGDQSNYKSNQNFQDDGPDIYSQKYRRKTRNNQEIRQDYRDQPYQKDNQCRRQRQFKEDYWGPRGRGNKTHHGHHQDRQRNIDQKISNQLPQRHQRHRNSKKQQPVEDIGNLFDMIGPTVENITKQQPLIRQQKVEQKIETSKKQITQLPSQETKSQKKQSLKQRQIPESLFCPISQDLMTSPVMIIVCGHTFEEKLIRDWLKKSNNCPLCKVEADQSKLQKNFALSSIIEHFK